MQDIAAEAKVSLRSVYSVASGKTALFRAVHETRARDLLARIELALSDPKQAWNPKQASNSKRQASPKQEMARALMAVISVVATFLMDHPEFLRIQLREGGTWALEDADRVLLVDERHTSDQLLERLFRRGIRAGTFHPENPRMMVASLRAQEQVYLSVWIARRGRISKKATIESIQRQARRLFCR